MLGFYLMPECERSSEKPRREGSAHNHGKCSAVLTHHLQTARTRKLHGELVRGTREPASLPSVVEAKFPGRIGLRKKSGARFGFALQFIVVVLSLRRQSVINVFRKIWRMIFAPFVDCIQVGSGNALQVLLDSFRDEVLGERNTP